MPAAPRFFALIPCAGSGSRAQTASQGQPPKQYRLLAGWPMVWHTLQAFHGVTRIAACWLVVAPDDNFFAAAGVQDWPCQVAQCGGSSRAQTVQAGLAHLLAHGAQAQDWVLVHDAARCMVTPAQINALIDACQHDASGGLLALKLPDTLKVAAQGRASATLPRDDKWLAQTPQMFRIGALLAALRQSNSAVTDEASAMEASGQPPLLVAGSAQNFKVTYPEDFALAEALLRSRMT
ncbi:MAG: 2-C-methyl-D-erythritol 4-phosphate cytidylyltransferase [Burkholderiales bacterium]